MVLALLAISVGETADMAGLAARSTAGSLTKSSAVQTRRATDGVCQRSGYRSFVISASILSRGISLRSAVARAPSSTAAATAAS